MKPVVKYMKLLKREPLDRKWHQKAECRGYDPAMWDLDAANGHEIEVARSICNTACRVRIDCARDALHVLQDESVIGPHSDIAVIRAGVMMKEGKPRSLCVVCGLALVIGPRTGICWPCRKYKPCKNRCGRGIPRKLVDTDLCVYCEEELSGVGRD